MAGAAVRILMTGEGASLPAHRVRVVHATLVAHGAALALGEGACVASACALLLACAWTAGLRGLWRRWHMTAHATRPLLGFAALAMLAALCSPMGLRHGAPGPLVVLLAPALIGLAGDMAGPRALRASARVFVLTLLAGGLGAMALGAMDMSWPRPWAFELDPSHRQGFVPGTGQLGTGGFYVHRLKMAHALIPAAAIGAGTWCHDALANVRGLRRWRGLFALTLSLGLLWPTSARAALGGVLVGLLAAAGCAWLRRASRSVQFCVVLALAAVLLAGGLYAASRAPSPTAAPREGFHTRAVLWRCALSQISLHPWGVGIGNVADAMGTCLAADAPMTRSPRTAPHNTVLCAWLLAGGAGAVLLLSVWLQFARHCMRTCADASEPPAVRGAAIAGVVFVWAVAVVGTVHDILFQHAVTTWVAYSLMGGLWWVVAPAKAPVQCA